MFFYKPEHFHIKELVDKQTYDYFGEQAWSLFNPYALISLDAVREYFDTSVYVNNWYKGGDLQFRGYRPPECMVGSRYSQHKFGNAFDLNVKGVPAEEVRQVILSRKNSIYFMYINRLEKDVNWVHLDVKVTPYNERILIVGK